jgi:Cu+-exporting ATPase
MPPFVSHPPKTTCFHCGEDCRDADIHLQEKAFCCDGCKMVYQIINQNDLCEYYDISSQPGLTQKIKVREGKFAFLEDAEMVQKLVHFSDGDQKHVVFYLPQMHCSSCIWLLEHLPKLNKGILSSQVNFLKKEVTIIFNLKQVNLRVIAELLTGIGYEPHISLNDASGNKIKKYDKSRLYKIGITGFAFGNIMLLSFPEYFSSGDIEETTLKQLFSYLNLGLALPVFFYCASEFFTSAYAGLKQKFLNIDAPIALAIVITFARSVYEILNGTGAGYLDSMSGIVFFMLLGRFFQNRTYETLSFDRDYTSYFPLGVSVMKDGIETQVPVSKIRKGDRIKHSQSGNCTGRRHSLYGEGQHRL